MVSESKKIKILVVDDSDFVRSFVEDLLKDEGEIEIIGFATDGTEAVKMVENINVDVILMDVDMPNKNGVLATKEIMAKIPKPIIIFTTYSEEEVKNKFKLIEFGALEYIEKIDFFNINEEESKKFKKELIEKIKLVSKINVIPHIHQWKSKTIIPNFKGQKIDIIGIGASTGGPKTLQKILEKLDNNFKIPIIIVQHISEGFLNDFVKTLSNITSKNVKIAENGEKILEEKIFFIPNGFQPVIKDGIIFLDRFAGAVKGFKPSINNLFSEIAKNYENRCAGIILTGMGSDGAKGLLKIKDAGGITIAQEEKSCTVFGMPKSAIEINAAMYIFSIEKIISFLNNINRQMI